MPFLALLLTDKLEDTKNPDSPIELREIEEEIVMNLVEDCQTLAGNEFSLQFYKVFPSTFGILYHKIST